MHKNLRLNRNNWTTRLHIKGLTGPESLFVDVTIRAMVNHAQKLRTSVINPAKVTRFIVLRFMKILPFLKLTPFYLPPSRYCQVG